MPTAGRALRAIERAYVVIGHAGHDERPVFAQRREQGFDQAARTAFDRRYAGEGRVHQEHATAVRRRARKLAEEHSLIYIDGIRLSQVETQLGAKEDRRSL